jgi:transcription-repair coupling factor (superfamily II helicase)
MPKQPTTGAADSAPEPAAPDGEATRRTKRPTTVLAEAHALLALAEDRTLLHVTGRESRAAALVRAIRSLAPERDVLLLPPRDDLPHDPTGPSARVAGLRGAAMAVLAAAKGPVILITSVEGALRRIAPPEVWASRRVVLREGDAIDPAGLEHRLGEIGYWPDDRIDEPGEMTARGGVFDLFPAGAPMPVRLVHEDGRIAAIRRFDPVTQRGVADVDSVTVRTASEALPGPDEPDMLPVLDLLGDPAVTFGEETPGRAAAFLELVEEAGAGAATVDRSVAHAAADWVALKARVRPLAIPHDIGEGTARPAAPRRAHHPRRPGALAGPDIRLGDVVVHMDHGLALFDGLETVEAGEAGTAETIRLVFADEKVLLVPAVEAGRIWRYGADPEGVSLDRLGAGAWLERREAIERELTEAAGRIATMAAERRRARAPVIDPPDDRMDAFANRFPFSETPDQAVAIDEVLADLASGRPMDRLVCGDVGFGKTEVALRAAAAAVFSGYQVALAAPTTVLSRQHRETFTRRFRGLGVTVRELSRFVPPADAKAVKQGLADGSVQVVIGTHALVGRGVKFKKLGLVIVDEEQRFGAAQKAKLASLSRDSHSLNMTATPNPRTLLSAMAGLRSVSVIATPPAARLPVRTRLAAFDPLLFRAALQREKMRHGRSFVVCPRIAEIEPMRRRLQELVPDFTVVTAHGDMPPREVDDALLDFAAGRADILLATSLIESGLDIAGADTMVIWRPERFGLSQLHQLRGRVGRGRARGYLMLFYDPQMPPGAGSMRRLETLVALDRLGAGFEVGARDLDRRGAGDLFGEMQSGHIGRIGVGLWQHLFDRALRQAQGEPGDLGAAPEIRCGDTGSVPESFIPEPEVRLEVHARLARAGSDDELDELAEEFVDRFGRLPPEMERLVAFHRLQLGASRLGIDKLEAGPAGVAVTFGSQAPVPREPAGSRRSGDRLILPATGDPLTSAAKALADLEKSPAAA